MECINGGGMRDDLARFRWPDLRPGVDCSMVAIMIYDHPRDISDVGEAAVIRMAWIVHDNSAMSEAQVHLLLGSFFGYPPCCIAAFIFEDDGDIATDDRLGTYFHCKQCYETKKVNNS